MVRNYELDDLLSIFEVISEPEKSQTQHGAECIVFSMDRAMQLHALLASYFEKVINPVPIHLFYKTSNESHQKSYDELISLFSDKLSSVTIQKPFREEMITLIESIQANKMFFLADDNVFIEDVDMKDFTKFNTLHFVPSLRLGLNLGKSYTSNSEQALPKVFEKIDNEGKICWKWKDGMLDWGYPISLDGNIFSTREILTIAKRIPFAGVNSFEANLHRFLKIYQYRYGVCYKKAKLFNIPCNKVQIEVDNRYGNLHQDYLLEKWNQGLQIDYRKFYGFVNESAHQEVTFEFIKRDE